MEKLFMMKHSQMLFYGILFLMLNVNMILLGAENDYRLKVSIRGLEGDLKTYIADVVTRTQSAEAAAEKNGLLVPVVAAEVVLKNSQGKVVRTTTTDQDGNCTFSGLPLAQYYIETEAVRKSPITGNLEKVTYRKSNYRANDLLFEEQITIDGTKWFAELRGRVVDQDGKGMSGIRVDVAYILSGDFVEITEPGFNAVTDSNGQYVIPIPYKQAQPLDILLTKQINLRLVDPLLQDELYRINASSEDGKLISKTKSFFIFTDEYRHLIEEIITVYNVDHTNKAYDAVLKELKKKSPHVFLTQGRIINVPDIDLVVNNKIL